MLGTDPEAEPGTASAPNGELREGVEAGDIACVTTTNDGHKRTPAENPTSNAVTRPARHAACISRAARGHVRGTSTHGNGGTRAAEHPCTSIEYVQPVHSPKTWRSPTISLRSSTSTTPRKDARQRFTH